MNKLFTSDDLNKLLQIPKRSIYEFAKKGIIPGAFKIGKHWRFRQDVIEKWIEERTKMKMPRVSATPMESNIEEKQLSKST